MRKIFLPLLLVALSPVVHSEGVQEVEIDAPLSGWHPVEGEDASFSQSINYPASSVNMAVLIHLKYEKNREDIGLFGI
ncbi:hypothetical protein ECDEC13D_2650 [Escherichia coli DEC13D]|nr:hypothetical protein ECDEC13C_2810 [Escherichia coli DEC13C]EHX62946.1 hypothetical protein ECDEC13D_2650 [Escherichia coli DEC13D]EHX72570.1 hypothetical protein ECDEC13E_2649 [Escherichia coli DEC13E]